VFVDCLVHEFVEAKLPTFFPILLIKVFGVVAHQLDLLSNVRFLVQFDNSLYCDLLKAYANYVERFNAFRVIVGLLLPLISA